MRQATCKTRSILPGDIMIEENYQQKPGKLIESYNNYSPERIYETWQ